MRVRNNERIPGWPVDDTYTKLVLSSREVWGLLLLPAALCLVIPLVLIGIHIDDSGLEFGLEGSLLSRRSGVLYQVPLMLGVALCGVWFALRRRAPKFVRVLRDRRDAVVWVYAKEIHYVTSVDFAKAEHAAGRPFYPRHSCAEIVLVLEDRSSVRIHLSVAEVDEVLERVRELTPNAVVGYVPRTEQSARQNPEALGRDTTFGGDTATLPRAVEIQRWVRDRTGTGP